MIKKVILFLVLLYPAKIYSDTLSIQVDNSSINGIYIGKHIRFLSEKDLFQTISGQWDAEKVFKDKIKSGELSSDQDFIVDITDIPGGYQANMTLRRDKSKTCIEWGISDIKKPEIQSLFKKSDSEILELNFMPHSFWLMFSINNVQSADKKVYVELEKHLFNLVHLFYYDGDRLIDKRAYFNKKSEEDNIQHKNPVFIINVHPGINTYYLRVDNWFVDTVPLRIWTPDFYYKHMATDSAVLGIITGAYLLIILYSLISSVIIRNISYFYLSIMALCSFLIHFIISGFGFTYLWAGSPLTGIYLFYGAFPLSIVFTILFCRRFVDVQQYTPLVDRFIYIIIILSLLILMLIFFVPFPIQKNLFMVLFVIDHFYYYPFFWSSIAAIRHKNSYGYFLIIALLFFIFSQVEWILTNLDIIPFRLINYLNIKGIAFIIIMMMGLGFKFRIMSNLIAKYQMKLDEIKNRSKEKTVTDKTKLKIKQVKQFLKENFREDISREGLASAVDISPDHLGRIFKKDTGKKISDFINSLRIEEAKIELEKKDSKIIDIAFSVGFESLRTFNKVFQIMQGTTPTEYRKSCIQSD